METMYYVTFDTRCDGAILAAFVHLHEAKNYIADHLRGCEKFVGDLATDKCDYIRYEIYEGLPFDEDENAMEAIYSSGYYVNE